MHSQVVETAQGPVECAIVGRGPAVLLIHGCAGGYQQGLIAARLANGQRFKFIALSRPGYLRTPLRVGGTPESQADAYAALLDALGIPKAAIIGISGGAPSALQFALRHPERCWALATLCGISQRLSQAEVRRCMSPLRRILFTMDLVSGLARNLVLMVAQKWQSMLATRISGIQDYEAQVLNKQENLDLILELLRSCRRISLPKAGLWNDMSQLSTMPSYPLESITAPTLVLYGSRDGVVSFAHASFIANTVPNTTLIAVKGGGHLFFATHRQQVVPAVIEFLKLNARKAIFESQPPKTGGDRLVTSAADGGPVEVTSDSLSPA